MSTALRLAVMAATLLTTVPAHAGSFEDAVLAQINAMRADPSTYARTLRQAAAAAGPRDPMSQEEPGAVAEAIAVLSRQAPLPALTQDRRLRQAAREHVANQGPTGDVGHGAPGNFGQRLQSSGLWAGLAAETISYGQPTPADVVRQLVIDSRVPSRGHRKELLGRGFQAAGVACGPHAAWGAMCVIDFAGAIAAR
jgi:uncharacterized protein YkwD